MDTETLGVYLIPKSGASVPKFATEGSACFDIVANFHHHESVIGYGQQNYQQDIYVSSGGWIDIPVGWRVLVPTGLILDIPKGFSVRLHSRSGLALKDGLVLSNAEGIIDSDYTQELMVMVTQTSCQMKISSGIRLCQAELVRNQPTKIVHCMNPPPIKTDRIGGFGSTGLTK